MTFDADTAVLQAFIANRAQYFSKTINDTTRESLLTSIKEGLDNGETLSDIETRIAGVYDIATGSRTQMIARTEISAASNEGAKGAYQQAGVDEWEWAVVNPQDEDCLGNDGEVVKIGDAFSDGSIQPPDPHPNCECTTIPVFS
jgi:SPP1 gp7 family putative phage head morphogenesis protein